MFGMFRGADDIGRLGEQLTSSFGVAAGETCGSFVDPIVR